MDEPNEVGTLRASREALQARPWPRDHRYPHISPWAWECTAALLAKSRRRTVRERLISAPLLAFYWWVREFPLEKSPADLRLESRLWAIAGRRDLARFCRLRAEVLEHPAGNGRRGRPRYSDAVALIGVAALVAVTVLVIVVDVSRWWFV